MERKLHEASHSHSFDSLLAQPQQHVQIHGELGSQIMAVASRQCVERQGHHYTQRLNYSN